MCRVRAVLIAPLVGLLLVAPVHAQATPEPSEWRPLRVAKWSAVTAAGAAALYGFVNNRRADEAFERIEEVCVATPDRCKARQPNGAYTDTELESEYQHIRALDRRARGALIGSQVGIATGVVLFILDLRNQRPPDNIPYEPRRFEIRPDLDGALRVSWTMLVH